MFFVSDEPKHKERKIKDYLNKEPMVAVLLAAANFEWTVGRCILFFSKSPNIEVRKTLESCHGLDTYKEIWKKELIGHNPSIPPLAQVIKKWMYFREAFVLRHRLIHGRGTCSRNMASEPVALMLEASEDLYDFAVSRGINLNKRAPIRRRKSSIP